MTDTLTTSTLESLRERVRNATGSNELLDYDIYRALGQAGRYKRYTYSIDECIELIGEVLPSWNIEIYHGWDRHCVALNEFPQPCRRVPEKPYVISGPTTPLALLEALLTALIEIEKLKQPT